MRPTVFRFFIVVALDLILCARGPRASAQQVSWPSGTSYSSAQAKRGEALYGQTCVACHGKDLMGSDRAPALTGAAFAARWSARPLAQLLDYMQVQMPLQSPGGLTRHQNADILAFMLQRAGVAAGGTDLWTDGAEGSSAPLRRSADYGMLATRSTKRAEALFSPAQALRGRTVWNRNCAFCHSVDPKNSTPKDLVAPLPSTFGGHFIERVVNDKVVYPNVLALYSKLKSMPAFNTRGITEQERVDVAAFILQSNGLPPGAEEIPVDPDAMRLMMLNEPGFERIFNGKDLTGWNFILGPNCGPAPAGCAKTDPIDVVRVEHYAMVCECHIHGHLYPDKKYKEFTLRFETKFERPSELAPEDDEELFSGGGGYKIFSELGSGGFNKYIEVEGRHRDILELVGVGNGGARQLGTTDLEAKRRAMHPLGEWNTIEIVAKDGQVHTRLNGVPVSSVEKHDYTEPGFIAFQSQGAKMYWRNIRVRVE